MCRNACTAMSADSRQLYSHATWTLEPQINETFVSVHVWDHRKRSADPNGNIVSRGLYYSTEAVIRPPDKSA